MRKAVSVRPAGILVLALAAWASRPCVGGEAASWPPKGTAIRVPVVRDTWFSAYPGEENGNNGGAPRMKTKSWQECSLVDIDPKPLEGRVILGATLHLHCESPNAPQRRLTVSTISSDWVEGTSSGYRPQRGSASYKWAAQDERPWAYPGSDLVSVVNGVGNTLWRFAECTPPDAQGWQVVAVEPAVLAARVAGLSYGFLIYDDVGSEYERNGEQFKYHLFPNRFIASREAGANAAPYFTVYLGPEDRQAPMGIGELASRAANLPAGEALVSWTTPKDEGPAGTIGFIARFDYGAFDWERATPVPQYLVPMAAEVGKKVTMHLRDLPSRLGGGGTITLGVRPVDGAGNLGPVATARVNLAPRTDQQIGGTPPRAFSEAAALPTLGEASVCVIDALDKVNPVTGAMIRARPETYPKANHLWSAAKKLVRLHAAKNEFADFQVVLSGKAKRLTATLEFEGDKRTRPRAEILRFRYVRTEQGFLPDPLVPLGRGLELPATDEKIDGQQFAALFVDIYVPHEAAAGTARGKLVLESAGQSLVLDVELRIWDFTLPDYLSFIPEMNCYGLPEPPLETAYYRLAHAHRTCLNRLPYHWNGHADIAPGWDGKKLEWEKYDARVGSLLDGSAFADLPRKGVPVDTFYLPLNENWPLDIHKAFLGGYWADEAFAPSYRQAFVEVSRQFAKHFSEKGWNDTFFEFYLNNKVYYKDKGWSRCSAPWIFDEPVNTQDFWALRWYGIAFHEGVTPVRGNVKMAFRGDISYSQHQRDILDGVLDVNVVGGCFRQYLRLVMDRKAANGEITFNYGSSNRITDSNVQPAAWCVETWCLGGDGVLPWQTIGNDGSWAKEDELSLFYPGGPAGLEEPVPSVRLKSYRRGQQDVEYLTLLSLVQNQPRWAVAEAVRSSLRLAAKVEKKSEADAGLVSYAALDPVALWELRTRIGSVLDAAKPAPKRKLVDLRNPVRDVAKLPNLGYVTVAPPHASNDAEAAPTEVAGQKLVIQGKPKVQDTIIDFAQPDANLGSVPRDNRIVRQEKCNAFLVRFDLADVPKGAKVTKALLSFSVWDPSSHGPCHVTAARILTGDWDEATATWKQRAPGRSWKGGEFQFGADTPAEVDANINIPPDQGTDTVDPPLEYQLDITKLVQGWADGSVPNYGLAIASVVDRAVDDGHWTRFQVIASEYNRVEFSPKLTIWYTAKDKP